MTTHPIKIGIPGAGGRMGGMIIREMALRDDMVLVAATDRPDSDFIGQDSGVLAGIGSNGVTITSDAADLFAVADVVIDFTRPQASVAHAALARDHTTSLVVGTTGLTEEDETALAATADRAALVYCANTSVGVTLLSRLVEQVAAQLVDGWDIEILETHHHHKVDAPSGTALALGQAAARGRGLIWMRCPTWFAKARRAHANRGYRLCRLRGGDVAGEHSVIFFGDSERVEISHKANDRAIFARGALRAARFAHAAAAGFYSMDDVLGG